jgi:HSP20 family protein
MNALTPWFGSSLAPRGAQNRLFSLRDEMDRLFDQFFAPWEGRTENLYAPTVNIAESDQAYEVSVDLPGLKPDEFNVEWKDNALWITGERKQEMEDTGKTYHRVERYYGQFRRVIPLETAVEAEKIHAEYKDGVLRLSVPKSEKAQPKKITVKA